MGVACAPVIRFSVQVLDAVRTEMRVQGSRPRERLKELLPHAEGPITFDRARHFLQEDRGPDLARAIVAFLNRTVAVKP